MNVLFRSEKLAVVLVAVHSMILGFALLIAPFASLRLFYWNVGGPAFFPSQTGVFLILLGGAYFAGLWHRPFVWLLVASKAAAVPFLLVHYALGSGPWILLVAAFIDASMGTAVLLILLRQRRLAAAGA